MKKMLQVKQDGVWVDLIPVIGSRPEYARMMVEKKLAERTRWRPEEPRDTPGNQVS
ncbi:hypothetical protein SEA_ERENYEAGER_96 [Microbacterium phage Erenyeager]|nr:hypothetical protein SEA_ERENYEAGER_96 [Microbacterium phage Erenyeager]